MRKKILILDDDNNFVCSLLNAFREDNFSFSIADSIERALYLLKMDYYDLIIANVKVPGGNSYILKKEIKSIFPTTKIIFMSSIDSDYDAILNHGEKCLHKYEMLKENFSVLDTFNNNLELVLENV